MGPMTYLIITFLGLVALVGIPSINLKADIKDFRYSDGSATTGATTFTKSDGVIDRKQVITRSSHGSGTVTKLWTNNNGGDRCRAESDNALVSKPAA